MSLLEQQLADLIWFNVNAGNWNADPGADPVTDTGGIDISAITGGLFPGADVSIGYVVTENLAPGLGLTGYTDWPVTDWQFIETFGGGAGAPGGATDTFQYNDGSGRFSEAANFTFNSAPARQHNQW